jgi:argininosuccinate lyase
MFRDAARAVTLVAAAMRAADFDVAKLGIRAGDGGTTLTELADTLVRDHGLPFRSAHAIAAMLLKARTEDPKASIAGALGRASQAILGQTLTYTEEQLETIMSPRHFVQVRTTYGGPAPEETARALSVSREVLAEDRAAWQARRDHLASADALLRTRVATL